MTLSRTRILAVVAVLAVAGGGSLASASPAAADEAPIVYVAPTPVVPQPVVPGHEGDVLLQVNVAMPATAVSTVAPRKAAHKAARTALRSARR